MPRATSSKNTKLTRQENGLNKLLSINIFFSSICVPHESFLYGNL